MSARSKKSQKTAKSFLNSVRKKVSTYLASRTHRSFRRTRRRDYVRPLNLPGISALTSEAFKTFWAQRKLFIPLLVVYLVLYAVLVGISSQATYSTISDTVKELGAEIYEGDLSAIGQASIVFLSIGTTGALNSLTEVQQIFAALLLLMLWLTVVWLLRNRLAGHAVRMRDGLYNAGAPLIASVVVALVIVIQLLPIGIAAIGYAAASTSGILEGGVEAMMFWFAAGLLTVLSIYWAISSLFAMVIITLPGMYPWQALRSSAKIVMGRRMVLILRTAWMLIVAIAIWALILIPFILLDIWLKSIWPAIADVPIVPVVIMIVSAMSALWMFIYIYLLYRKVVDNE